jgi:hypothetical protein
MVKAKLESYNIDVLGASFLFGRLTSKTVSLRYVKWPSVLLFGHRHTLTRKARHIAFYANYELIMAYQNSSHRFRLSAVREQGLGRLLVVCGHVRFAKE